MKSKIKLFLNIGVLLLFCFFYGCRGMEKNNLEKLGKTPPTSFLKIQLKKTSGVIASLSQVISQKPTILIFFSTWCASCEEEINKLLTLYPKYKYKIDFLAINSDMEPNIKKIQNYIQNHKIPFPVMIDFSHALWRSLNIQGLPTTVWLKNKKVVQKKETFVTEKDLQNFLESSLKQAEQVKKTSKKHFSRKIKKKVWVYKKGCEIGCPLYIVLQGENPQIMEKDFRKAIQEIHRIEAIMSSWKANSEIMRLNKLGIKKKSKFPRNFLI